MTPSECGIRFFLVTELASLESALQQKKSYAPALVVLAASADEAVLAVKDNLLTGHTSAI